MGNSYSLRLMSMLRDESAPLWRVTYRVQAPGIGEHAFEVTVDDSEQDDHGNLIIRNPGGIAARAKGQIAVELQALAKLASEPDHQATPVLIPSYDAA